MHIPPYDNQNRAIVDAGDDLVPLTYFNIVRLKRGESFTVVGARLRDCHRAGARHGRVRRGIGRTERFDTVGERASIWEKEPSAVYVPVGGKGGDRLPLGRHRDLRRRGAFR